MRGEDPERLKQSVGRQIAERRLALGMTQEALGVRLRVSAQYVGLVERGVENLSIDTLARFAAALGCRVRDLFDPPASMRPARPGRPKRKR